VLHAVTRDYDHVHPLVSGEVSLQLADVSLEIEQRFSIDDALEDDSADVAEVSWNQLLQLAAAGDDTWIAVPLFLRRGFGHRAWFVAVDSAIEDFAALRGTRVGAAGFGATGNTWSRVAAREAGLDPRTIEWVDGPLEQAPASGAPASPTALLDQLLSGELAAVIAQQPPVGYWNGGVKVRRLLADYSAAERGYVQRTGIYPAHHIVAARRAVFAQRPEALRAVYDAFETARRNSQVVRLKHGDTSPWLVPSIEDAMTVMGRDWQPNGSEHNAHMTEVLCEQLIFDDLLPDDFDPARAFADFDSMYQESSTRR
jgi:4,5-dihydroxyphthalate decarboxylase